MYKFSKQAKLSKVILTFKLHIRPGVNRIGDSRLSLGSINSSELFT